MKRKKVWLVYVQMSLHTITPPPQLSVTMLTYKQDEGTDVKEQKLAKDSYHPCAEKS